MFDSKLTWVVCLAFFVFVFLSIENKKESFSQGNNQGKWPDVYKDYEIPDAWHKYWYNRQKGNESKLTGLPDYKNPAEASFKLENHQFYPLPMPRGGHYKTLMIQPNMENDTKMLGKNPLEC